MAPGHDGRPVQTLDRDVLADGAGHDRAPLGLQAGDRLHSVEAHRALRAAVVLPVSLRVAVEALGGDARLGHRLLRNTAVGDADLHDSSAHCWASNSRMRTGADCTRRANRPARDPALGYRSARRIIRWMRASSTTSPR